MDTTYKDVVTVRQEVLLEMHTVVILLAYFIS
jgi:hypothetical protein